MAVSIDATNLQLVDNADGVAGWSFSTNKRAAVDAAPREGNFCIGAQGANPELVSAYHDIGAPIDFSARTLFVPWMRASGVGTFAQGGFCGVLSDGTNEIAYHLGGVLNFGSTSRGFSRFRLDGAVLPSTFTAISGSEANLNINSIDGFGGAIYNVTAPSGSAYNLWFDIVRYITNGLPALKVSGGTVGNKGNFGEIVAADDATTNAWGVIFSKVEGGKVYELLFGIEIGDTTATDSYFEDTDFQLFMNGTDMSAGNMDFEVVGGTGTNYFKISDFSVQGVGTVSNWDVSDTNLDTMSITNGSFTNIGTVFFPPSGGTTREVLNTSFDQAGQLDFSTITASDISISNSTASATGAVLLDTDGQTTNQTNFTFTSGGTGHGVLITAAGSYTFNNWQFNDYSTTNGSTDAMVYNNSGGAVTITVEGGGTNVSVRNGSGATTTVVNNATVSLTRLLGNTEISVLDNPSPYSATSLPAPTISPVTSTERVSADTNTGNGTTDYIGYTNNGGFVQINANGLGVNFTNFPGVLQDTNSTNPRALAAGDKVRVTIRDDADNPSLQLFDEFEVSGTPSASTILTTTTFSTFTSAFGTTLNSANSKTVTVEKVDARFTFSDASIGDVIDILAFRTGSNPVLSLENTAVTGNIPLTQVGDRNYRDPA